MIAYVEHTGCHQLDVLLTICHTRVAATPGGPFSVGVRLVTSFDMQNNVESANPKVPALQSGSPREHTRHPCRKIQKRAGLALSTPFHPVMLQSKHQSMTACRIHVTNRVTPGSGVTTLACGARRCGFSSRGTPLWTSQFATTTTRRWRGTARNGSSTTSCSTS